jgi:hypothetical protein
MSASPPKIACQLENVPAMSSSDPVAEVAHLRSLIEKQPSCLLRVRADGTLLAVSDAALSLLGASELAKVLDTNLMDHLKGAALDVWVDFAGRVLKGGSASAECEMTDLAGAQRDVMLAGVALCDHPDGVESLLVTVRDVSAARRLEASLQEQDGLRKSIAEANDKLAEVVAERGQFEAEVKAVLEKAVQERDRLVAAVADRQQIQAALEQASAERDQLREALRAAIAARQHAEGSLEEAIAEREQQETLSRQREAKRQQLFAEQASGRMKAEQALADARVQLEQLTSALSAVMAAASATRQVLEHQEPK